VCLLALPLAVFAQPDPARPVPNNGMIDRPGSYVLLDSRSLRNPTDVAITISASNVTLDLGGHTLMGPGGKMGTGLRIQGAQGVTVSNGTIANFAFGVVVAMSANVKLTGLQIRGEGLVVTAPPPETGIMIMQSRNVVVENNSIYNTGLGVFVRGGMSWGNRIAGNTITAGTNGILGICYNPTDSDPMGPRGDLIQGNVITGFQTGFQASATSETNLLKGNFIWYTTGKAVELLNATNMDMDNFKAKLP
jgi:parallel beta-helix repeat protein